MVCKLMKSLYRLKQVPRQWYKKFDLFMIGNGYKRTSTNYYVYIKKFDQSFVIILLYVDDMLIFKKDLPTINRLKELNKSFAIMYMGPTK